ncbi:hypothetical protein VTO42DRAFT_5155 [Malbranchea cinnamomea]
MSLHNPPKALLFDVFGTVVDWRSTITTALTTACRNALRANSPSIPIRVQQAAREVDWHAFAQQWRNSYIAFTRGFDPSSPSFTTVDEHHYDSLKSLLAKYNLDGLFSESEIKSLSLKWHFLDPWKDSPRGLEELNKTFITATLSNGNTALLEDLAQYASLSFNHVFSAEQFKAYKPSPLVYNGAAAKLGLQTNECALVAAHLGDLRAAKRCGYQTIYVARPQEEAYSPEDVLKAKADGWVDMWIDEGQDGLLEVAKRFATSSRL